LKRYRTPGGRREIILVAVALVLLGSIPRGMGLPCPVVREGPTGDHQPLLGARAFALEPCLYPVPDQRDRHRPFLAVSYRQMRPRIGRECLAPRRHRLPRGFRAPSTPCVRGQRRLQVTYRGGARDPQQIAFTTLAQLVAKPRVAPQFIVPRHPAVRDLLAPQVEHLYALLLPRVIPHLRRHVTCVPSLLVACPLLGQRQAEVE